ncbi:MULTISPECIES: hypothetical protein [Pedobacter]|uniref:hypothetical protein n=1 Tax=Pedobacter TaxID=84567 RepID=UPI00292F4A43|nr:MULTISPECIES: hypothetical protein [Pedobacter]
MNTLKKISFGAFAFIFGLTLVLTQSAFKPAGIIASLKRVPVTVYYHGPSFLQAEVEKESNWTTTTNSQTCNDVDQVPCSLQIDNSYVSAGVLQNSALLSAAPNTITATYYVQGSADGLMEISNRTK